MEAENIKAGNICQPGGRKWWRSSWEHGGCCLSAGTWPSASGDLTLAGDWALIILPEASSRVLHRAQVLTLNTAKAKMAVLRILQILKLSRMQSLPSHAHSPVAFA